MSIARCRYLEWDSQFFGLRMARLEGDDLTADGVASALSWCAEQDIDCLYFLASTEDPATALLAHRHGFQPVDIRVTLERSAPGETTDAPAIRPFQAADAARLRAIARVSHRDSRFYADARFPRALCDQLYETWIERSYSGWADAVLVAEAEGQPAGYLSCHLGKAGTGSIGLLAVASESQGRGLGRQLVAASLEYFGRHGMKQATVVTQGSNIRSQRLYQRSGFLTQNVQLWYHYWCRPPA